MSPADIERFWSRVDRRSAGCWPFATRFTNGYGVFWVAGQNRRAHRVAYELTHGRIPGRMCVLHRCDNPACVRPDHLFLGTHADNTADKMRKLRYRHHERHHSSKLTMPAATEIRQRYATGEVTMKALAREYGVDHRVISNVVYQLTWREPGMERLAPRWSPRGGTCKRGHPFDDVNTARRMSHGRLIRLCRTCERASRRKDPPGRPRHERHWNARLTLAAVMSIRTRLAAGGVTQSQLAREYGVKPPTIAKVASYQTWQGC